jgi:hypothetical protein
VNKEADSYAAREAAAIAAAIWQAKQSATQASTTCPDSETSSRWKMEGRREVLDRMP